MNTCTEECSIRGFMQHNNMLIIMAFLKRVRATEQKAEKA